MIVSSEPELTIISHYYPATAIHNVCGLAAKEPVFGRAPDTQGNRMTDEDSGQCWLIVAVVYYGSRWAQNSSGHCFDFEADV